MRVSYYFVDFLCIDVYDNFTVFLVLHKFDCMGHEENAHEKESKKRN